MYRSFRIVAVAGDDQTLKQVIFGPRELVAYQTLDLESATPVIRIGPSDAEAQVSLAPVTTGYCIHVTSDYPVKVRVNGSGATQFTMHGNNVAAVNVGAPLPDKCWFSASIEVTSLYLAPISSAAQTANVKVFVSGDPTSAYV